MWFQIFAYADWMNDFSELDPLGKLSEIRKSAHAKKAITEVICELRGTGTVTFKRLCAVPYGYWRCLRGVGRVTISEIAKCLATCGGAMNSSDDCWLE